MPHSAILSGKPMFRSSDVIGTPADVRVTARKSITVKMGRDDAPAESKLQGVLGSRESISTELAKITPKTALEAGEVLTYDGRSPRDAAAGVFRTEKGHYVRTVAMDETPLGTLVSAMLALVPVEAATSTDSGSVTAAPVVDRKAIKAESDRMILAYLHSLGYDKGHVTPRLRQMVLDVIETAKQDAAYCG